MTRIGIEIGGTKQQIVVGDAEGRIIDRCRFTVDPAGGGPVIRDRMAEELPPILAEHHPEPTDRFARGLRVSVWIRRQACRCREC